MKSTIRFGYRAAACALLVFGWIGLNAIAENEELRAGTAPIVTAATPVDAGRYLVTVGGCNDCHTPNWEQTAGNVPESEWLTGVPIGFRGPWGTTYPSNLRLLAGEMSEDAWVAMLKTRTDRPPMPWMNLNRMHEADARAVYRFIRSLGSSGTRMPAAVGPGVEPVTPYFDFEPRHMERAAPVSPAG